MTPTQRLLRPLPILLAFLALAAAVYWRGLYGGFVYDDWGSITGNPDVQVRDGTLAQWWKAAIAFPSGTPPFRSLTMLSFAANHYLGGLDPFWFKLTNLALHLLNGLLLFLALRGAFALCRAAGGAPTTSGDDATHARAAAAIAGLWLLLPINLTAVLYVVQRLEALAATSSFLGLWWYARERLRVWRGESRGLGLWIGVGACTAVGLLAKETAVMLPLYAALLEFCTLRGRARDGRWSRPVLWLYAVTLLVPFCIGLYWMSGRYLTADLLSGRDTYLVQRLLTESRVVSEYIGWTLFPRLDALTLYHDDIVLSTGFMSPPATLAASLFLGALLISALALRRTKPLYCLGVLWFFAGHLLTATVVPLILAFEHRNYFPSAGLLLAVAALLMLEGPLRRPRARIAVVGAVAAFFAATTAMRAAEWSDPTRLAASDSQKRPDSPTAQFDYAQAMLMQAISTKQREPANIAFRVLEQGRKLPGAGIHFEQALITLLGESGYAAPPDFWNSLGTKLERGPIDTNGVHAFARLNHCFQAHQCKPEDVPRLAHAYDIAFAHSPGNGSLLSVHGEFAWHVQDDHERAEQDYRDALRLSPTDLAAQSNLIVVLIHRRKFDEAVRMIDAMQARNRLGALDGFVAPLRATLEKVRAEPEPAATSTTR